MSGSGVFLLLFIPFMIYWFATLDPKEERRKTIQKGHRWEDWGG